MFKRLEVRPGDADEKKQLRSREELRSKLRMRNASIEELRITNAGADGGAALPPYTRKRIQTRLSGDHVRSLYLGLLFLSHASRRTLSVIVSSPARFVSDSLALVTRLINTPACTLLSLHHGSL